MVCHVLLDDLSHDGFAQDAEHGANDDAAQAKQLEQHGDNADD